MKKKWIVTLPFAFALAACTSTAGSPDGASPSAPTPGADDGVIVTASPSDTASASPSAAADSTPSAAGSTSGEGSVEVAVAPDPGGGASGHYGYVVRLANRGTAPITLTAPYVATLHDKADANLSNAQPLDFTDGAPTKTLQPAESTEALLIVTNADVVDGCWSTPAAFLNIDSASGTYKAPLDDLNIQGCQGGIGDLLSTLAN